MKTVFIILAVVLTAFQLNAQSFVNAYIHIIPDFGGSTGELLIQECFDPNASIAKTITFDGNLLPSGQATGISGNGIKTLHYVASDGSSTYEFMANIDFNFANPSITYTITPIVEPMSVIQTHRSSSPNCDGEINLITSGGNVPTFINWFQNGNPMSVPPGQTILTNICPGNYGYNFGDSSVLCSGGGVGNGSMFNVTIDEVSCIILVNDMSCFGVCDGSADLFLTGSNPGGMISSFISNSLGDQDATNLYHQCAGVITGQVMDYTGATAQCQNYIGEPDLINFNLTTGNGSGQNDGKASVNVTAGDGPFSYDWTGPNNYTNTGDTISGLAPGNYSLLITYNNGHCDTMITFDIIPIQLVVVINGITPQTANPPNGAVNFTISGGVQPYDTILDNGQTQVHGGPFDQLSFGNYTLRIIDNSGETAEATFMINAQLSIHENQDLFDLTIYPNPASESFTIEGKDLKTIFIYDINGRIVINQLLTVQSKVDISNLESGIYTLKVQSKNKEYIEKLVVQ